MRANKKNVVTRMWLVAIIISLVCICLSKNNYIGASENTGISTLKNDYKSDYKEDKKVYIGNNIVLYDEVIPDYEGKPYIAINDNKAEFLQEDIITTSYETYGELDELGRCTSAIACIGKDILPTEPRESISHVYPTGWYTIKYDIIEGKYLYNRCHLIGYQLTGENANKYNLITGTRYMNVKGMLPFEEMVADYVKETSNHVVYRVTPIFKDDNLVASGVHMEAFSVEDGGAGIQFNVFVYNVQPGIYIDYSDGFSEYASKYN